MVPMMPPPQKNENKIPRPESISEIPGYLRHLIGDFFTRLLYIYRIVWETRPWILFVTLFIAIFNGVVPVISAKILSALLNTLVSASGGNKGFEAIITLLVLQFAVLLLRSLVGTLNTTVTRLSGELVVQHIKTKIITKAKELDMASFDLPEFYEKLENANREAGGRPIQILNSTFTVLSTAISMISFVVVLWAVSPVAPLLIVVFSIPTAIISFRYRKKSFSYIRRRSKDRRRMNYYSDVMVNKDLAKEIRIFGLSDTFIGKFREVFAGYFHGLRSLILREAWWQSAIAVVSTAVNCALYLYIAKLVFTGAIQVGDYTLYTGALSSIASGISTLVSTTATVYEGTLFIDNMIAFRREKPTVVPMCSPALPVPHGCSHTFEFRNVSFKYPGTERNVLENINLSFGTGDTVVLVGLNGAGKTTLIKLLTRLYDPTEGTVFMDGKDIRCYDVGQLYSIFGIIFQDFGKYAATVRENIEFGQITKQNSPESVEEAAIKSGSYGYIEKLPQHYDTPLMRYFEETGTELSIGQWQKLAIARAFYGQRDVLILDEPTASLDALAEQEIYASFDALRKYKTTVFVSHRLSSATAATKIVVLDHGKIIETGTHDVLMKKGGHYHTLFTAQASRYAKKVNKKEPETMHEQ